MFGLSSITTITSNFFSSSTLPYNLTTLSSPTISALKLPEDLSLDHVGEGTPSHGENQTYLVPKDDPQFFVKVFSEEQKLKNEIAAYEMACLINFEDLKLPVLIGKHPKSKKFLLYLPYIQGYSFEFFFDGIHALTKKILKSEDNNKPREELSKIVHLLTQEIDQQSFEKSVVLNFILGSKDANASNFLLVKKQDEKIHFISVGHAEIMPESHLNGDKTEYGITQCLYDIKDGTRKRERKKIFLSNPSPLRLSLLGLPQAKKTSQKKLYFKHFKTLLFCSFKSITIIKIFFHLKLFKNKLNELPYY